jgi:branched-chain amino acid transport system substrate-binding protein
MTTDMRSGRRRLLKTLGGLGAAGMLAPLALGRAKAAGDAVILAVAAPMTGNNAAEGLNARRGADLAVAAINQAGGIGGRKISYDIFDDQGSPREAAAVAQRILDADKYLAVVGHVDSSCTLAAMPIYSDADMPVLCASSSNPAITESGWTDIIRTTIRDDYGAQQYSAFAINNLGKKRLGILFSNDDYGRGLRDEMVRAVAVLPGAVVADASFTPNVDKDFSSIITDFQAKHVDAFMLNCSYTEGGLFLGQAKGLGVTGAATVGPDSLLYDQFIQLAQGAAEGAYILASYDPYSASPLTRSLIDTYAKDYAGGLPSEVAVFTYDLFHVVKAAMAAGATSDTLIKTIKGMTFEGAGGHYAWDEKGDVKNRTFAVIQVKDETFASTGLVVDETGLAKLRG